MILLDVGLPSLNGIEAARQIREVSPTSRIIFMSQESSAEVVQEAFRVGALGYVIKTQAGVDLLAAVEAVLGGGRFVSSGLSDHGFTDETGHRDARSLTQRGFPTAGNANKEMARNHEVRFYSDDESLLLVFAGFIEAALLAGNVAIVLATEAHQRGLFAGLCEREVDLTGAIAQGRYICLDIADTLSNFMVDDLPDPIQFNKVTGNLIASAAKAARGVPPRVAACGECAPTLWAQGKVDAAVQLEHLWDEIAKSFDVEILCGYLLPSLQSVQESDTRDRICAEHSSVSFA
jgi:hypothetical protein